MLPPATVEIFMSVYTPLSTAELEHFLSRFALGSLQSFRGITAGIENSNFFVSTGAGEYVLTIFEHHTADEVQDFVRLARHLGQQGLRVPAPVADRQGEWLHQLKHKPAILCPRLPGEHIANPQPEHCAAIGSALAQLHIAAADLSPMRPDNRDYHWWLSTGPQLVSALNEQERGLLEDELAYQTAHRTDWLALPQGWIHGDLFHDNALFSDDGQVAILDLYNASAGALLYDLAVVANDWCCDVNGVWKDGCVEALLSGYQTVRPLTAAEQTGWNLVLRGAALRFWLSRLLTRRLQQQQAGELALQKDPAEFMQKLLRIRNL